jgi:hypothetical protein
MSHGRGRSGELRGGIGDPQQGAASSINTWENRILGVPFHACKLQLMPFPIYTSYILQ